MADPTKPEVKATIGGKEYTLCFNKRALFRLGSPEHSGVNEDIDEDDYAALFWRCCVYAYCMQTNGKFKSAEDVAADLETSEMQPLADAITSAITAGQEGKADDPL